MAEKEMLVVGSKVKNYIKAKGLMSSSDMLDAINCTVQCVLDRAAKRAEANGRKTIRRGLRKRRREIRRQAPWADHPGSYRSRIECP